MLNLHNSKSLLHQREVLCVLRLSAFKLHCQATTREVQTNQCVPPVLNSQRMVQRHSLSLGIGYALIWSQKSVIRLNRTVGSGSNGPFSSRDPAGSNVLWFTIPGFFERTGMRSSPTCWWFSSSVLAFPSVAFANIAEQQNQPSPCRQHQQKSTRTS